MSFLNNEDRDSNPSSDDDQDELMEDADDGGGEAEADDDVEGEDDDNDDNDGDDGDEDEDETQGTPHKSQSQTQRPAFPKTESEDSAHSNQRPHTNGVGPTSHPQLLRTSASPRQSSLSAQAQRLYPTVRPEALTASLYDIVPTMAAPQGTSINAITATPDMRYWFSGGSDCCVRKYDGAATINGKTMLTVAQKHPFVDSVVKAGVLMSYWENEEPKIKNMGDDPNLSPVYSLAVHSQALWLLSGLESGAINLQSVRHDEGKRITWLEHHTSAVSVLTLAADEKSVLSGSWDKNIFDWDLNTGQVRREFTGNGGQISAIRVRPSSSLPVPEESGEIIVANDTFSSNNAAKPVTNGILPNGVNGHSNEVNGAADEAAPSPTDGDSLFGGGDADSLFGDNDTAAPSGGNFGGDDDDDEFSRAMNMGIEEHEPLDSQHDTSMLDATEEAPVEGLDSVKTADVPPTEVPVEAVDAPEDDAAKSAEALSNGLPHSEEASEPALPRAKTPETQDAAATSDSTFLAAAYDGTLLVWDRRQPTPVARIPSRTGGPWCMDACWSPDGNYIYAGRRNNTVEEFSLHKGLKTADRTFKFPAGSGPVSAVRAMPNGRHLICASYDILRLYDLKEPQAFKHSTVPFLIVPGPPRAGVISALHIDPTCKYMLSAAGNRGWEGSTTEVLIGYEIGIAS